MEALALERGGPSGHVVASILLHEYRFGGKTDFEVSANWIEELTKGVRRPGIKRETATQKIVGVFGEENVERGRGRPLKVNIKPFLLDAEKVKPSDWKRSWSYEAWLAHRRRERERKRKRKRKSKPAPPGGNPGLDRAGGNQVDRAGGKDSTPSESYDSQYSCAPDAIQGPQDGLLRTASRESTSGVPDLDAVSSQIRDLALECGHGDRELAQGYIGEAWAAGYETEGEIESCLKAIADERSGA